MQMNRRTVLATLISFPAFFRTSGSRARETEPHDQKKDNASRYTVRKFTAPFYPVMARQTGIEGDLTALVQISRDGRVASVTDIKGHPLFGPPVSDALMEWQFDPLNGEEGQMEITFSFMLKGDSDQRVLNYTVSGILPNYIKIEVNPFGANP